MSTTVTRPDTPTGHSQVRRVYDVVTQSVVAPVDDSDFTSGRTEVTPRRWTEDSRKSQKTESDERLRLSSPRIPVSEDR